MRIRAVEARDVDALARIHAEGFAAPWSAADFAAMLRTAGAVGLITGGEGEAAGFLLWRVIAGEAEVLTLAVHPASRRKGLARNLLRAALASAEAAGASALFLEVATDNAAAIGLYESEGFSRIGERRAYYARPGTGSADALVLRRDLNT